MNPIMATTTDWLWVSNEWAHGPLICKIAKTKKKDKKKAINGADTHGMAFGKAT